LISAKGKPEDAADDEIDALVREMGLGIAIRRSSLLSPGLAFATWLFREGPERLRRLIVEDCAHGLMALLEEASYERPEPAFDVPSIRAACFRLASTMARASFTNVRAVGLWLEVARKDPLPEVR